MATNPYIMMDEEERVEHRKKREKEMKRLFKFGLEVDRMPVNKPKISKIKASDIGKGDDE